MEYDKLIRDKVPKTAKNKLFTRILSDSEFKKYLELKFYEETNEVILAPTDKKLEELGDLLEVIINYASLVGVTLEDIIKSCEEKREVKGGFEKRLLLYRTED